MRELVAYLATSPLEAVAAVWMGGALDSKCPLGYSTGTKASSGFDVVLNLQNFIDFHKRFL